MASLKINLRGVITVFALCLIGTASAAPNGNGDEKEETKEVKAEATTTLQSNFLVNKDVDFEPRDTADPSNNCDEADLRQCVYQLTPAGMENVPEQTSYSPDEIDQFVAAGWIEPHPDSNPGLYLN